jgi:hypothetical protein
MLNTYRCACWFFSASFGGSILNLPGPGITMSIGVLIYMVYVVRHITTSLLGVGETLTTVGSL